MFGKAALDSLRIMLSMESPRVMLMREIEVAIVYIYIYITLTTSITFLSKFKFMHNPTLLSVMTSSMRR
jgi:hypothetical protein